MTKAPVLRPSIGTPSKNPELKRTFRPPETEAEKTEGPDGAKSWVVAFAAFMINFIMAGLSRMSGILYVAFIEMFHVDRKGASMPFSVRSSTMNLLGPVVGMLGQKYGVRKVSVIGGVLGTFSAAACYFAEDITWLTIMWGGVNGVGTALVTTLTTVVVSQYFDKYRTTASGMSFSGACIGSFIFPPLIEELLHIYGLGGSFLIVAGIIMHVIPAAMILRKPIWVKRANRLAVKDVEAVAEKKAGQFPKSGSNENPSGVDLNYLRTNKELVFKLLTVDMPVTEGDKNASHPPKDEILREMEDVYSFVGKSPVTLKPSQVPPKMRIKFEPDTPVAPTRSFRTNRLSTDNDSPFLKSLSPAEISKCAQCKPFILSKLNELHHKSENQIVSSFKDKPLYTQVLKELRKLHKVYEAVKKRNIFTYSVQASIKNKIVTKKAQIAESKPPTKTPSSNGFWDSIKASVKLHGNPLFLLIALCRAIHFATFIPVVTIIVDYTMDKGLMEEDGKYVIACLSVGDLVGRLCLGWVTDRGFMSMPRYMMVVMIFQGACTAMLPQLNTKMTLLPTIAMYAMLQGSVFVRHSVLISKYMKISEQSIAMGCVNFLAGVLGFGVPVYVGFFRDTMGSYDCIFYLNGAVGALTGLLWIFEPCLVKSSNADGSRESEPKV